MKNGLIIAGVVIVAVLGYQFVGGSDESVVEDVAEEAVEEVVDSIVAEDGTFLGSLLELSKSNEDWTCTVSLEIEGITTHTTSYISGDNIRTDSETEVPVMGTMTMSIISDEEYMYSWSSLQEGGYKMLIEEDIDVSEDIDTVDDIDDTEMELPEQETDLSKNVEYNCEKWDVDTTLFELPDIEFELITI